MKNIILFLAFVMILCCNDASAQKKISYQNDTESVNRKSYKYASLDSSDEADKVPLGSGLLILGGLAFGYAFVKKTTGNV